jgi:hypothetical protein
MSGLTETDRPPRIEILSFDGCPNRERAIALVSSILVETGTEAQVQVIDVPGAETAQQLRFLGSPTIRVNGRDIEPGADERTDYAHGCRVFRTEKGLTGDPDPRWLRAALAAVAGGGR